MKHVPSQQASLGLMASSAATLRLPGFARAYQGSGCRGLGFSETLWLVGSLQFRV